MCAGKCAISAANQHGSFARLRSFAKHVIVGNGNETVNSNDLMKLSELTETQRGHMAWRLDHKTACGLLTALRIAQMEYGDLDVAEIFQKYGGCSPRSAKIHATKCVRFCDNVVEGFPT